MESAFRPRVYKLRGLRLDCTLFGKTEDTLLLPAGANIRAVLPGPRLLVEAPVNEPPLTDRHFHICVVPEDEHKFNGDEQIMLALQQQNRLRPQPGHRLVYVGYTHRPGYSLEVVYEERRVEGAASEVRSTGWSTDPSH